MFVYFESRARERKVHRPSVGKSEMCLENQKEEEARKRKLRVLFTHWNNNNDHNNKSVYIIRGEEKMVINNLCFLMLD